MTVINPFCECKREETILFCFEELVVSAWVSHFSKSAIAVNNQSVRI